MKLSEFKAWFEGYTESMDGTPSKKQWERIKEQVKDIDGVSVSYPVYIDRYVKPYWGDWYSTTRMSGVGVGGSSTGTYLSSNSTSNTKNFDGVSAMYAAGKAESLAA